VTSWLLIRHGATDWNRDGRYQGQADPPLNEEGWTQAERLADMLAVRRVEAVYSSDLQRARDTAETVGRRLGLTVFVDGRLREINQGVWEGMLVGDIATGFPAEWRALREDPLHARAPGGESVAEVAQRAMEFLAEIARRTPHGAVAVFSHGLTLACVLCTMDGVPLEQAGRLVPPNGDVLERVWPEAGC
jgi:phosphoserine phosphatase